MEIRIRDSVIQKRIKLPPLGSRIKKTGIAVLICLLIHLIRGYQGIVAQSCVAAIICMQPSRKDSLTAAGERVLGMLIGALWGLLFLQFVNIHPIISKTMPIVYLLMALGVVITLYSTVLIRQSQLAALSAIVFLGVVIDYPNIEEPFLQTYHQVIDTLIGIAVAYIVDAYHPPRKKHQEYLFFIRLQDLVPDRYAHISPQVLVLLNRLYDEGARISLVTRWAPAFLLSQMGIMDITIPVIVMDGAALYDIGNKQYQHVISIPWEDVHILGRILLSICNGYCLYTVTECNMSVYRIGSMNETEESDYQLMKRSPYRNYMLGEPIHDEMAVFLRVIDTDERINRFEEKIKMKLPESIRMVKRELPKMAGCSGLFFYQKYASVAIQKEYLIAEFKKQGELGAVPVDISTENGYMSERDALQILNKVQDIYEPVE